MSISRVYKVINDIDEMVYVGSTIAKLSKRMTDHRKNARNGDKSKFYKHMRDIGIEHFKIVCVREYTDISKERLQAKEAKYIMRYDTVKNGLNTNRMMGRYFMHNRERSKCVECGGGCVCIHQKHKQYCKECRGVSICIHNNFKRFCVECGGSEICSHGRQKRQCKECKGPAICIHEKSKYSCKICSPAKCERCGKIFGGQSIKKRHQKICQVDPSKTAE